MMKTLCVAVFMLSLTSVCQPATLACESLLKPVDKGPALPGSWYLIAISSDTCLVTTLINAVLLLSAKMDITPNDTPDVYNINYNIKMYGYCASESESLFYQNSSVFDVTSNNTPTGDPDVLLQSGCPDCIILKTEDIIKTLILLSRRRTITAAEMKEFEAQTKCLGWSSPQVLNSDHDYENCRSVDDEETDIDHEKVFALIAKRLKSTYTDLLQCLADHFILYPRAAYEWVQQLWI